MRWSYVGRARGLWRTGRAEDGRAAATQAAGPGRRGRAPRVRQAGATMVATVALALALAACNHGLPSLPVGLGACYESLPLAEGALNVPKAGYTFKGVKLVSPKDMEALLKKRYPKATPARLAVPKGAKVCAFAFTGAFAAGQVAGAPVDVSGKAAIVLITTDRKLLFSFVIAKLPERFSREFIT